MTPKPSKVNSVMCMVSSATFLKAFTILRDWKTTEGLMLAPLQLRMEQVVSNASL
jgi:hypothetical protein